MRYWKGLRALGSGKVSWLTVGLFLYNTIFSSLKDKSKVRDDF